MRRTVRLTESDLARIVRRVINEKAPAVSTPAVSTPTTPTTPTTGQNIKSFSPKITVDCLKKVVTSSQLPKLADKTSNLAMNTAIIKSFCSSGQSN